MSGGSPQERAERGRPSGQDPACPCSGPVSLTRGTGGGRRLTDAVPQGCPVRARLQRGLLTSLAATRFKPPADALCSVPTPVPGDNKTPRPGELFVFLREAPGDLSACTHPFSCWPPHAGSLDLFLQRVCVIRWSTRLSIQTWHPSECSRFITPMFPACSETCLSTLKLYPNVVAFPGLAAARAGQGLGHSSPGSLVLSSR